MVEFMELDCYNFVAKKSSYRMLIEIDKQKVFEQDVKTFSMKNVKCYEQTKEKWKAGINKFIGCLG